MDTFPFSDVGLSRFPLLNVAWETSAETSDKLNCIGPNTWFQVSIIRVDQWATKCTSFNGFIAKPLLNSPDWFSGQRRGLLEMSETNRPKFQRLPTLTSQESPPAAKVGNTPKCKQNMISFRPQGKGIGQSKTMHFQIGGPKGHLLAQQCGPIPGGSNRLVRLGFTTRSVPWWTSKLAWIYGCSSTHLTKYREFYTGI